MLKKISLLLSVIALLIVLSLAILDIRYGGGESFPDRTGPASLNEDALQVVANLELPPGNIAVSKTNRVIFSFHPEAKPEVKVAEIVEGNATPLQLKLPKDIELQNILGIRIDSDDNLWLLDNATHGIGQPRLLAFSLSDLELVHRVDFAPEIAGLGSHLNDLSITNDGRFIFIADASIFGKTPALIIYDTKTEKTRRVLANHESVIPDYYTPVVQGLRMELFGVLSVRPGVDSIALDRANEWLYFAPVTDLNMYRIKVETLIDESLSFDALANAVENFAPKSMSDGISTDNEGRVYITDIENSSINRLWPDGRLETYIKTQKLRWPDGLSFGPGGWLYISASSLQHVIFKSRADVIASGPYQIFRLKTDGTATPGQ